MRAYRFFWLAILGGAVALAAPGPQAPPVKDRKKLAADCRRFAQQVHAESRRRRVHKRRLR